MEKQKPKRILAINQGMRKTSYVVFDTSIGRFIDYGWLTFKHYESHETRIKKCGKYFEKVISQKQISTAIFKRPETHVVFSSKQPTMLPQLTATLRNLIHAHHLPLHEIPMQSAKNNICDKRRATKKDTAKVLISYFPELEKSLETESPWKLQRVYSLFDTATLALFLHKDLIV